MKGSVEILSLFVLASELFKEIRENVPHLRGFGDFPLQRAM